MRTHNKATIMVADENCERAVLAVLMSFDPCNLADTSLLSPDSFYNEANKAIYMAAKALENKGDKPDPISVNAYIQAHPKLTDAEVGLEYILDIAEGTMSAAAFPQHCRRLAELSRKRHLWRINKRIEVTAETEAGDVDETVNWAIEELKKIDDAPDSNIKSMFDALKEVDQSVDRNLSGQPPIGVPTGFRILDQNGGLQPSDLILIAAETSQGKTSLALDIAINAAKANRPVAFYSTEMTGMQLAARAEAPLCGIPSNVLLTRKLKATQLEDHDMAMRKLEEIPFYYDDTSTLSVDRIVLSIRTMYRKHQIQVAFIDYLQVLQNNKRMLNQTEEQFFGETARRFKNLAKELGISIVLLSQLSRDSNNTEPSIRRLRGSGQPAEAADIVLLIYRPEVYGKMYTGDKSGISPKGTAQITIAKGRNIGLGDCIVGFNPPLTHFYELENLPTLESLQVPGAPSDTEDDYYNIF